MPFVREFNAERPREALDVKCPAELYYLGYFDLEQKTLQPLDNPFGMRLSPMSYAPDVTYVSGPDTSGTGAPRPMKMGNIVSPWRYDAAACCAIQLASLRPAAMLHYAGYAAAPP